jgi:ketosteroid isomerase-like protein
MRKLAWFLLVPGLGLLVLAGQAASVDSKSEKEKIRSVLKQYVRALEAEDVEKLSKLFAQDDDLVTISVHIPGIGLGPKVFKDTAKSWFDAVQDIDVTIKNEVIKVNSAGSAAWVSFTLDESHSLASRPGRHESPGMRVTWGLEKRKGSYLIVQGHWSFVLKIGSRKT